MLMLACYASQHLIKASFYGKNQYIVRLCKYEGKLDSLTTYLENNYQTNFFPYIMLSLETNSIQFTNLNISEFSRKRFLLNSNAFEFMYNIYLTMYVQLHSNLNSFSAAASVWYTSCWEEREKLLCGGAWLFSDHAEDLQGLDRCSGSLALGDTDILR